MDKKDKAICSLTLVIILLYFCLPLHLTGAISIIAPRLAVFIALLSIGILSKAKLKGLIIPMILTLAALAMLFASLMSGFYKFNAQAEPLRRLLEKTEKNKRLAQLYTYPGDSGFFFHSFAHFSCYYTIWKDGLCGFIFPQMDRYHILELKRETNLRFVNVFDSWRCVFPHGWKDFDYFLVCGRPASEQEKLLNKPAQLRLMGREGIWRLYQRR